MKYYTVMFRSSKCSQKRDGKDFCSTQVSQAGFKRNSLTTPRSEHSLHPDVVTSIAEDGKLKKVRNLGNTEGGNTRVRVRFEWDPVRHQSGALPISLDHTSFLRWNQGLFPCPTRRVIQSWPWKTQAMESLIAYESSPRALNFELPFGHAK